MTLATLKALRKELQIREASAPTQDKRMSLRVASLWVEAATGAMEKEYDIMLRLQVLEGAAGVPIGTWWKKGRRGLITATKAFEGEEFKNDTLNPSWLSPQPTGMYKSIAINVDKLIKSYGLATTEADDLINFALMGLSFSGSGNMVKAIPYGVGVTAKRGILGGNETPSKIGSGPISSQINKKVRNEARDLQQEVSISEDDKGRPIDFEDTRTRSLLYDSGTDLITALVFKKRGDSLGKLLRKQMRKTWSQPNKVWSETMPYWLDNMEKGRLVSGKQVAEKFRISHGSFSVNHWKGAWIAFFMELWKNKPLIQAINKRLEAEGLDEELVKPDLSKVNPSDRNNPLFILLPRNRGKKKKKADSALSVRVAALWFRSLMSS